MDDKYLFVPQIVGSKVRAASEQNKLVHNMNISILKKVTCVARAGEYIKAYENFEKNLWAYLPKIANNVVRKICGEVLERYLVRVGIITDLQYDLFAFVAKGRSDDVVKYIVLPGPLYDIDYTTFDTPQINNCIYGIYYGMLRAGVIMNWHQFYQDENIRKYGSLALGNIVLNCIPEITYDTEQLKKFRVVMFYIFCRYYMGDLHPLVLQYIEPTIEENFSESERANIKNFISDILARYKGANELPSMLHAAGLYDKSNAAFIASVIKRYGNSGISHIFGVCDLLLPYVVLMKYPTTLIPKKNRIDVSICSEIEKILIPYVKKVRFEVGEVDSVKKSTENVQSDEQGDSSKK